MNSFEANPKMSVIVITPDDFTTVRRIVSALSRQTSAADLEIVFVSPDDAPAGLEAADVESFSCWKSVRTDDITSSAHMRALGTEAATTPIVAFCEDHCFPAPEWAEALLARHVEDWAGVGAVVENANPRSTISWSNLLVEYGDWLAPRPAGPIHHIGGHNSCYKRDLLLDYGSSLSDTLEAESTMQWDLAEKGHRFYLESKARIFHTNMEMFVASLQCHFNGGRLFASNRRRVWGLGHRLAYFVGAPLIPLVRLLKCTRALQQTGRLSMLPGLFPSLLSLLVASGIGEMFGYGFGPGKSVEFTTDIEFRYRERFLAPPQDRSHSGSNSAA
jgi:hypothetical protein